MRGLRRRGLHGRGAGLCVGVRATRAPAAAPVVVALLTSPPRPAGRGGYPKVVRLLVAKGPGAASVEDARGWRAVDWALSIGHLECAQALADADVPTAAAGAAFPGRSQLVSHQSLLPASALDYRREHARRADREGAAEVERLLRAKSARYVAAPARAPPLPLLTAPPPPSFPSARRPSARSARPTRWRPRSASDCGSWPSIRAPSRGASRKRLTK